MMQYCIKMSSYKSKIILTYLLILPHSAFSQNWDFELLRAINSPEELPSDNFFRTISNSEPYLVVAVPLGIGLYGLTQKDEKALRNSCVIVAASVFSAGLTNALKYTIDRERPFITYPDIIKKSKAGSPSFPSGHTSSAFATATSLSIAFPKWYVIVPSFGWAGAVGYSRMHLGVHYPSDVLAGAAIGAGSAWLTSWVNKKLRQDHKVKP